MTRAATAALAAFLTGAAMAGSATAQTATQAATSAWTWTLYDGDSDVVLANEVPDTPQLKTTLECEAGSGVVRVSLYESGLAAGFATLASGDASAAVQIASGPDGSVVAPLRTDHPVFGNFKASGALSVAARGAPYAVEVQPPYKVQLRRFADLCGG